MRTTENPIKKAARQLWHLSGLASTVTAPIFLVGCGRSGSTILGTTLANHKDIAYLNEPFDIWLACYPQIDVWTEKAPKRQGAIALTSDLCTPKQNRRLHSYFSFELARKRKTTLVEKYPINSFRLDFLQTIFPDARFIYLIRNGIEVARSIERGVAKGSWNGKNNYKWKQLTEYAQRSPHNAALIPLCDSLFNRALLEWKLSVEAASSYLQSVPPSQLIEVRYEALVQQPVDTLNKIQTFIDIGIDPAVTQFASDRIQRRSAKASAGDPLTPEQATIAGDLLRQLGYAF